MIINLSVKTVKLMKNWFTLDKIDTDTYVISEYKHWEETHCYLLNGKNKSLLIDTGLGICNISEIVRELTDNPVIAIATHIHWDHIGGHRYYSEFYAHKEELNWLNGSFPQKIETVRKFVTQDCDLPVDFDINLYELFQGTPTKTLYGGENVELGGRTVKVFHTPGHSPGHMCFYEADRGYLYTGDLIYKGMLMAWFPSTNPTDYLNSLEEMAKLPVQKLFPGHHNLDIKPETAVRTRDAFRELKDKGQLYQGSGIFNFEDFSVHL